MKTVYICTDMEGISGIDTWDQCYNPDDNSAAYLDGLQHLAADVNATVEGCVRAGLTDIRVVDGHGRNRQTALGRTGLHPAATLITINNSANVRLTGLDKSVDAVLMVGQHAMAGTINGFIDHTQLPKELCRYLINGEEHGELSEFVIYAGSYGVPLVHVSGDEALCTEARRIVPGVACTPTKRGTGWETCELYPTAEVRANITRDVEKALKNPSLPAPFILPMPAEIKMEFAWSAYGDRFSKIPGVRRENARTVSWRISDPRDVYSWPTEEWKPA